MTTDTASRRRFRLPPALDLVQYGILAFVVGAALTGAFTHMHDWTIREINGALVARGLEPHTPGWFGWANAITSELLPASAFLSIQQRKRQGRPTGVPWVIFLGAFVVSMLAQLSATGADIPYAAEFLATLPALAVLIMSKVIFGDIEHAGKERAEAERAAVEAAELARVERERKAELSAERRRRDAELAAELSRRQAREDAELAAELERQRRDHEAELERERLRVEAEAITRRAEIEAGERRAEREAAERREARELQVRAAAEAERARVAAQAEAERQRILAVAEAERVRAEAARVEVEALARKEAVERVAAARHAAQAAKDDAGTADDEPGATKRRRPRPETQALVNDVLTTLDAGTPREAAIKAAAAALDITPRYASEFIPDGWVAGGVAPSSGRHLHLAAASSA